MPLPELPLENWPKANREDAGAAFQRVDPIPTRGDDAPLTPAHVPAAVQSDPGKVVPAAAQAPAKPAKDAPKESVRSGRPPKEDSDFAVLTEIPGPQRLFQRESESQVFERLRRESVAARVGSTRVFFPEEEPITREPFAPRMFHPSTLVVEPSFVCHRRLFFEQDNFERAGWDIGPFQLAVCLGAFYYDILLFPYHYGTRPCQRYDCSAGKCLPGDATPLLLYPFEWSLSGAALQAAVVGGFIPVFP